MIQTQTNFKTAPGHQVLAAAGKQTLRSGGRTATEKLFAWADFQSDETVLELAASFGYSAINLAQNYGVSVVGIEKNPDSVVRANANVKAAGLTEQVEIVEGDIFHLENLTQQFDYVLAEAILTMQSAPGKTKILKGICDRLKPNGLFLSHELFSIFNPCKTELESVSANFVTSWDLIIKPLLDLPNSLVLVPTLIYNKKLAGFLKMNFTIHPIPK